MSTSIHVYIAGPMTIGDAVNNVRRGIDAAEALMLLGFVPFCPHLGVAHHFLHPHTWEEWLCYDEAWLSRCDVLLRLPGESLGADREEAWCRKNDLPVFYELKDLRTWAYDAHGHESPPLNAEGERHLSGLLREGGSE